MANHVIWTNLVIRLSIYLTTLFLFSYQTFHIADEYFKYQTTTLVTLVNLPRITIPPKVGFRVTFTLHGGVEVKKYFDKVNDTTNLVKSKLRFESQVLKSAIAIKKFFRAPDYYVSVEPKKAVEYTPENLYTVRREMFYAKMKTNLLKPKDNGVTLTFFLRPYSGDLEGVQKTDAFVFCPTMNNRSTCDIRLSYSTKMVKLAPVPYDTNCRNYHQLGFTSNENCLSLCLNNFTVKHGYIINTNVISREKYRNSSLLILPYIFRKMKYGNDDVDERLLRNLSTTIRNDANHTNNERVRNASLLVAKTLLEWVPRLPAYKVHHHYCRSFCGHDDCFRESLVPHVLMTRDAGNSSSSSLEYLEITIYPSNDEVVIVTSQARLSLLDLLVYISSSTSFWFGLSPLSLARYFKTATSRKCRSACCRLENIELRNFVRASISGITRHRQRVGPSE